MTGPLAQQIAQVPIEKLLIAVARPDACEDSPERKAAWDEIKRRDTRLSVIERHVQDMETALDAARLVADMHESREGFQWVGSEDDTEALDALCRALAALPAREKGTET